MADDGAQGSADIVTGKRPLIEHLEAGCKPEAAWKIGVEHERFAFQKDDLRPLRYDDGAVGIRGLLDDLIHFGWQPEFEAEAIIGLTRDRQTISLEPAGQFEFASAPVDTIREVAAELEDHRAEARVVGDELGIGFLAHGFQPKWTLAELPWMPKSRFHIMRGYMPKVGRRGLDMMARTCAAQVSLDFASEADMVRKLRLALALQPVATALLANAPIVEGRPSGFLSARAQAWLDVDPVRTGLPPFVFEDGMGFERYVDYALDVPMYSVRRGARHVDTAGQSFRDFLAGRLPTLPGERPTLDDWAAHLQTLMPEVRLKRVIEIRGADSGSPDRVVALAAFWAGLLYERDALDAAWDLVRGWHPGEFEAARRAVPRLGLAAPCPAGTVRDLALRVLEIARFGLQARAHQSGLPDERDFLAPLVDIASTGRTPAEATLDAYATRWDGEVDPLFSEQSD